MLGFPIWNHVQKSVLRSQLQVRLIPGSDADHWLLHFRRTIIGQSRGDECDGQRSSELLVLEQSSRRCRPTGKGKLYRLLRDCIAKKDLVCGRKVHSLIVNRGLESDNLLASHLIRMYASQGSLPRAKQVFSKLSAPDEYCWAAIISAHCQLRDSAEAISLYRQLRTSGIKPNDYIIVAVLKACTNVSDLEAGRVVHEDATKSGVASSIYVDNTLIDMYSKCGDVGEARRIFDGLQLRDLVSWNAMIAGYAQQGFGEQALRLFQQMQNYGPFPDAFTFVSVLKACSSIRSLGAGREIHEQILQAGLQGDLFIGNTLVDMYSKCGDVQEARRVFEGLKCRDNVSWTSMIAGYSQNGMGKEALQVFRAMIEEGVVPSFITFLSVLKACGSIAALDAGRDIHMQIRARRLEEDVYLASALIDMYAKCGCIEEAQKAFEDLKHRDLVSWNAMIAAYALNGLGNQSLLLFEQMQKQDFVPDVVTFMSVLRACGSIAALDEGKKIHRQILRRGLQDDLFLRSALVDMYAKCGDVMEAHSLFEGLKRRDTVLWTALIAGYAQHGLAAEAFAVFEQMQAEDVTPNSITLVSLLTACNHAGLVDEGRELLRSMSKRFGITPVAEHYACMVDLLGRAGFLEEAEELIRNMPVPANATVWMAMLGACHNHGNIDVGRQAFESVVEVDPKNCAAYVLLSNMYAAQGMWEDRKEIRRKMIAQGITKEPGCTWIEVGSQVFTFVVGGRDYRQNDA